LIDYIPRGSYGFALITTRESKLRKIVANVKKKLINVLWFALKGAEILLRSKLSEDGEIRQEDANEITKVMDCLPFAVTLVTAYLDQNGIAMAKYL
jgi:hypothetical protein